MALCPNLLILDVRHCKPGMFRNSWIELPPNLRIVTIVEYYSNTNLILGSRSLRSFRFSGSFLNGGFYLPADAALADLYLCFRESLSLVEQRDKFYIDRLDMALPNDLSGLTVLTVCSDVLPVASSLIDEGPNVRKPKMSNLHGLRELQLLMLKMEAANLADIYVFLKICQCPNLERLFVLLPTLNYEPIEASLDVVGEEPLSDGLHNLKIVKVMNFSWRCTEVRLMSFLLRKANSLNKVLLVSPNVAPLDMPGVHEADLLLLKEAMANGKIMLSEVDDGATQPYHSEVFINF